MARGAGWAAVVGGVRGRPRKRLIAVAVVVAVAAGIGVYAVTRPSGSQARVEFALGGGTSAATSG